MDKDERIEKKEKPQRKVRPWDFFSFFFLVAVILG